MSGGGAALGLLARLKLRGLARKRLRYVRRPTGAIFAVLGLSLLVGWIGVLAFQGGRSTGLLAEELAIGVQAGALLLVFMTCTSALSHRGLYLPPSEIELLLSAPVSRRDLVRYRVLSSLGRALFGGLVIGVMAGRWMPRPLFGFIGAFVATLFLPILGQGVSLLAGSAENRVARWFSKLPFRAVNLALLLVVVLVAMAAFTEGAWGGRLRQLGLDGGVRGAVEHPFIRALGAPFHPWAMMMTAREPSQFLAWLSLNLVLWVGLFELVARIPVDFRELSLATSADIAKRLRRHRRGGAGVSGMAVSKRAAGRRVPWLFGRGPFGAIAWRKSCSILRKARGTLLTGAFIIGLLTVVAVFAVQGGGLANSEFPPGFVGSVLIAGVGTVYLCAGLRFDFREDLEQMEAMKSWPMPPWRLFLATLVPEVVLVSLFVASGIAVFGAASGFEPAHVLVVAVVPMIVLLWVSIDNAVFLYAPIRYTPGQEGALHHTGRALTLMLVRMFVFLAFGAGVIGAWATMLVAQNTFGWEDETMRGLVVSLTLAILLLEIVFLVWVGGRMLRRFDVARDTG